MSMVVTGTILVVALAVLVGAGVVIALLVGRRRHDWAEPTGQPRPPADRAPYGADAPGYPAAPPPAATASMSEGVEGLQPEPGPAASPGEQAQSEQPEPPRRLDDSQRFRDQPRPDDPASS